MVTYLDALNCYNVVANENLTIQRNMMQFYDLLSHSDKERNVKINIATCSSRNQLNEDQ